MKKEEKRSFKRFFIKGALALITIIILVTIVISTKVNSNIKRYPDYAKEYYYKNSSEKLKAYYNEHYKDNLIEKDKVLTLTRRYGFIPTSCGEFYYLFYDDNTRESIRDKFFKGFNMSIPSTKETDFFKVKVKTGIVIIEASTGKAYYYKKTKSGGYSDYVKYYDETKVKNLKN